MTEILDMTMIFSFLCKLRNQKTVWQQTTILNLKF